MAYSKESELPSVTQILSPYSGYDSIPDKYLDAAAERGTLVHTYCAAIALNQWFPDPEQSFAGYVKSFKVWFGKFVDKVLLVEEELESKKLGYCGHPDFLFESSALKGVILIDLKTPKTKKEIWGAQVAAYEKLIESTGKYPAIDRVGSLRLNADGKAAVFDDFTGERLSHFAGFYAALQAYKFFKK